MIPFIKPYFDADDFEAVRAVMRSGWVAQGPKCEEFEEEICRYLGCNYAITVSNCTAALYLSLLALGIKKGDEVIVPDYTFPATALAVLHVGAMPVLVDVDRKSYNVMAKNIEMAITKKTRAMIPVHLFGRVCDDMDEITRIAKYYSIYVIEDAACSFGARFPDNKFAGTIGNIGCFSLHASKGITTGEGGICVTNDVGLATKIRRFSCFGDERTYRKQAYNGIPSTFHTSGFNFKMSDITAAIGLAQLKKVEKLIDWRIKVAEDWNAVIMKDDVLKSSLYPIELSCDRTNIYQSVIAVAKEGMHDTVKKYLISKGAMIGIGTHACHVYKDTFPSSGDYPMSSYLFQNAISLPRYYGLDVEKEWYS